MANPVVKNYVDAALAQLRRGDLMRVPAKVPNEMRDGSIPARGDWIGWQAIPSTVTSEDLDVLESELGLVFPPLYRDFLQYMHFFGLTEFGVRFEQHLPGEWIKKLRRLYSWYREQITRMHLLPIGDESMMDAGPVCFDTRARDDDGDCPIVFWDHEWVGSDREVQPMFSSFGKILQCLTIVASADSIGTKTDDGRWMQAFLTADPTGAGGPARDYWTSSVSK